MKRSVTFIVAMLVVSTLATSSTVGVAQQKWNYFEELNVLSFGRQAYWTLKLTGGNITAPGITDTLQDVEFTVSAVRLTDWRPEYEVLTELGVGLISRETLLREGVFLQLSRRDSRIVDAVNDALKTAFDLISTDERAIYLSPIDYENFVKNYFWSKVKPNSLGGLQSLVDQAEFLKSSVSIVEFGRSGNGDIWVSYSALQTEGIEENALKFSSIFGDLSSVSSAGLSNSTKISIRKISGQISRAPEGALLNFANNTAQFTRNVGPAVSIVDHEFDFAKSPPQITFTRRMEAGAVASGDVVEVILTVNNSAPAGSLDALDIDFTDSWWEQDFEMLRGSNRIQIERLGAGDTRSQVYQLRLKSNVSSYVTQSKEQSTLTYAYNVANEAFAGLAIANSAPVALNNPSPALRGVLEMSLERLEGMSVPLKLTITNYGSRAAFDVIILKDGLEIKSFESIPAGSSRSVPVNITLGTLVGSLPVEQVSLIWTAAGVEAGFSNSVSVVPQSSSASYPSLIVTQRVKHDYNVDRVEARVEVDVENSGFLLASNVTVNIPTHPKLNVTVSHPNVRILPDGSFEIGSNRIAAGENFTFTYLIRAKDQPANLVLPPVRAFVPFDTSQLTFQSSPEPVALGIGLDKEFSRSSGFVTANITVSLGLRNLGGLPLYDVVINDLPSDSLTLTSGERTGSKDRLGPGDQLEANYEATMRSSKQGPESPMVATITLAGRQLRITGQPPSLSIYSPPKVSIEVQPPTPVEDEPFTLVATVRNDSPQDINDVKLLFELPGSLRLVSGSLENTLQSMPAGSNQTVTLSLSSAQALSVLLPSLTLRFSGDGIAYAADVAGVPIGVTDNVTVRYFYPLILASIAVIGTLTLTRILLRKGSEAPRED